MQTPNPVGLLSNNPPGLGHGRSSSSSASSLSSGKLATTNSHSHSKAVGQGSLLPAPATNTVIAPLTTGAPPYTPHSAAPALSSSRDRQQGSRRRTRQPTSPSVPSSPSTPLLTLWLPDSTLHSSISQMKLKSSPSNINRAAVSRLSSLILMLLSSPSGTRR